MLEREMNKKGQEMSITTILLIVLGLVVVVVIILAANGVFGPIFAGLKLAPSGISTLVKACEGYASIQSQTDYCTFREVAVDSKTEYVNCLDRRVQDNLASTARGIISTCPQVNNRDPDLAECIKLIKSGIKNPIENGNSCGSSYDCTTILGGIEVDKNQNQKCTFTEAVNIAKTKALTEGFASSGSKICCVAP